jgi:Nudix hydrolase domain/NUDIX domain
VAACNMLQHTEDMYGGVIIDADGVPSTRAEFENNLSQSLQVCPELFSTQSSALLNCKWERVSRLQQLFRKFSSTQSNLRAMRRAVALPGSGTHETLLIGIAMRCFVMQQWRQEGKRGIWLKLPTSSAHLVPIAVAAGFAYHLAEPDYLMLTQWLASGPSTLPANASHQVGVGAVVLNAHGEMLVVKERSGPAAKAGIWKMPTGLLEQGEDYSAAAEREVHEETV